MTTPITSKAESIALLNRGAFGSRMRTWPSLAAMRESGYHGNVVVRCYRPSFRTIYDLPQDRLDETVASLAQQGYPLDSLYCNEVCPDEKLVLQGELFGRSLTYSTAKAPMKQALLVETRHSEGSATEAILRWAMNDSSHADFQVLRERHPNAVIEFGCYGVCLGDIPHRNTIIWEVRDTF